MKTPKLTDLTSLLRKTPGNKEFSDVVELLPHASLIVDSNLDSILFSNKKARKLLVYRKKELKYLQLLSIFPKIKEIYSKPSFLENEFVEAKLIQHSGLQIAVNLKLKYIGYQNQWVSLIFESINNPEVDIRPIEFSKQKWQSIRTLSKLSSEQENSKSIRQLLKSGSILIGANLLGLYLPDPEKKNLQLINAWGNSNLLAKIISENELKHLHKPLVWKPDSTIFSSFNKSNLSKNSQYIASMPLTHNNPKDGLLLISDQENRPPEDLFEKLDFLTEAYNSLKNNAHLGRSDNVEADPSLFISQTIENAISDGLILVSEDLKIINLNSTAEITLGYLSGEVKGENLQDILIGSEGIIKNINKIVMSDSQIQDFGNIRIRRRDSQSILLHIRAMPIIYEDNNILAILISDQSLHEEIQAEANRLRDQALLGEITATFAHEVRNPINNISTSLQLMEIKFPEDTEIQKQIGRMKHDCDRLTFMINSILSYSKTREHKLNPFDLVFFIENLSDRWQHRFEKNNIESRLIISDKIPRINAEKNALEQVFTNLIGNAVRAMKDQDDGLLVIKVEPIEENGIIKSVSIDISDNGPGIPVDIQEKIFKPFFTTNTDGTGIGLTVTKRIISSHNGELSLKSFPGGTIFNIKFPVI